MKLNTSGFDSNLTNALNQIVNEINDIEQNQINKNILSHISTSQSLYENSDTMTISQKVMQIFFNNINQALNNKQNTQGYFWARHELATGNSEANSTAGSYLIRSINTLKINTINGASLSSNQITLPAGTYRTQANAPFYNSANGLRIAIYNITDSVALIEGTNGILSGATGYTALVSGSFTLTSQKNIGVYYWVNSPQTNGLGLQNGQGSKEIYTNIEIWKTA